MSSVSRTRATNLTGLIDIDSLVEANLLRQKTKINTATQKMKVEQYKQEQYREVITKSKKFYNKYCDILSGGSLLSSSSYNAMKATSNNSDVVTATASSKASAGSYEIKVSQAAKSPSVSISADKLVDLANSTDESKNKIIINNKEFTLLKPTSGSDEEKAKQIAEDLNNQLKKAGIKVTAKYTDLYKDDSGNYGGMIIQSDVAGKNEELLVVGTGNSITSAANITEGKDAVYKGWDIEGRSLSKNDVLKLNDDISVTVTDSSNLDKIVSELNSKISASSEYKDKITASLVKDKDGKEIIKITSNKLDTDSEKVDLSGINPQINNSSNGVTEVTQKDATNQSVELDKTELKNKSLIVSGKKVEFVTGSDDTETVKNLNEALKKAGLESQIEAKEENGKINLISKTSGTAGNFTVGYRNDSANVSGFDYDNIAGKDAQVTIKDLTTNVERVYTNVSNEIEVDGITFKIDENAAKDSTSKVTVKADGTELKDKIVEFINDYNELLGHINGKLYEEYDRSYLPLTDDDKEGLSDSEIEKLEKKAQTGLLKNDSYLRNFADDMKLTMTTMLEKSGLSLEKIGINPVEDYSTQNGLFTIDEDKLLSAIEENPDGIKELFSGKDGIVTKLSENLKDHATGTFSKLANKAGVADGVTANTNEMTKDIEQRKKLITQMQTALQEKEDALYTKYSTLESNLASLQSQQSSLSSYFQ